MCPKIKLCVLKLNESYLLYLNSRSTKYYRFLILIDCNFMKLIIMTLMLLYVHTLKTISLFGR